MLDFYMFVNLSFCFACIITFVAVIINTFMTWFHMLFKFIFPCRFLTALVTVITYTIMIWFNNLINLIKNLPNCISCSGYGEPAVYTEFLFKPPLLPMMLSFNPPTEACPHLLSSMKLGRSFNRISHYQIVEFHKKTAYVK